MDDQAFANWEPGYLTLRLPCRFAKEWLPLSLNLFTSEPAVYEGKGIASRSAKKQEPVGQFNTPGDVLLLVRRNELFQASAG